MFFKFCYIYLFIVASTSFAVLPSACKLADYASFTGEPFPCNSDESSARLCWGTVEEKCSFLQNSGSFNRKTDPSSAEMARVGLYRDLFYSYLNAEQRQDAHHHLLLPAADLLSYPDTFKGNHPDKIQLDTALAYSANFLAEQSKHRGFGQIQSFELKAGKVLTFILISGMPSEINVEKPFDDVAKKSTSFSKRWQKALRRADKNLKEVDVFSYRHYRDDKAQINEMFDVFSLDAPNGKPLVNIISLTPPAELMESATPDAEIVHRISDRLAKLWQILGDDLGEAYLLGHSMGVVRALNLVDYMERNERDRRWYRDIAGVLSLAGAIWGNEVASVSEIVGSTYHRLFKAFRKAAGFRKLLPSDRPDHNVNIAIELVADAIEALSGLHSSALIEGLPVKPDHNKSIIRFLRIALKVVKSREFQDHDPTLFAEKPAAGAYSPFVLSMLRLANLREHFGNDVFFLKVKRLLLNFVKKVEATHDRARSKWFSEHTLPARFRYIALTATMSDAYSFKLKDRAGNSFDVHGRKQSLSNDYRLQRSIYYDSFRGNFLRLRDGSVNINQSLFYSKKHRLLNPAQEPYNVENIALFGTHHLGVWLGTASYDGAPRNNFPRIPAIKAIRAYLLMYQPDEVVP